MARQYKIKVLGMAPVFDHNKSLFPEVDDDRFNDLIWYIAHCKPWLGTDHITKARELLTPEIRQDVETVCHTALQQHPKYKVPTDRFAGMQQAILAQIREIVRGQ